MALGTFTPNPVNQWNRDSNDFALVIEEFTGMVEGTIERRSVLADHIPVRPVSGTTTITNFAVGETQLHKVTPGTIPDGDTSDFAKQTLTIDTTVYARAFFDLLSVFQTQIDVRRETASEQGKKIAKFRDQAFLISAIKAAMLSKSAFWKTGDTSGRPEGHFGGSVKPLGNANDANDPGHLYKGIGDLLVMMEQKDVDPRMDDVMIVVTPATYNTLMQSEMLVNMNYTTAVGNKVNDGWVLKAYGVPVISSNNLPTYNTATTGAGSDGTHHLLSNSGNGNAYDIDASDVVALAFSSRAIMAGETIPVSSDVFYDKMGKTWVVDSHMAFASGPNRAEYAGVLVKP